MSRCGIHSAPPSSPEKLVPLFAAEKKDLGNPVPGYIKVNDRLETTASDVWAMGDCAGSPQCTHVAYHDFRVVRENLKGGNRTTKDRIVPFCMFTDPELARVGRNETGNPA